MASRDEQYLEHVRKHPGMRPSQKQLFEDHFEFNSLPYSVYRRFIELLLPITNHFFRKTSKHNYQQCLDLRGIELSVLEDYYPIETAGLFYRDCITCHGSLYMDSGIYSLNLNHVQPDWIKWLVVIERFFVPRSHTFPDMQRLNFVRKYKHLYVDLHHVQIAEHLVHPNLEKVAVNGELMAVDVLLDFLKKLNVCKNLLSVCSHTFTVESAAIFNKIKRHLEEFYRRHQPSLVRVWFNNFKIRDGVLCSVKDECVKEATFEDLPSGGLT